MIGGWLHITLIAAFSGLILLVLLLFLIFQRFLHPQTRLQTLSFQDGISRLHQVNPIYNVDPAAERSSCRKNMIINCCFNWADHPSLVADAVENGWPRFCFADDDTNVEMISWEEGSSSDQILLQKVRLKKKMMIAAGVDSVTVIRTALPLPGPRFGNSFFPQQTYFEITIFSGNESDHKKIENHESILLTVGLTRGGNLPLKYPGRFPGSIGFNSTGSVYLNGLKLVLESEKYEWGSRAENVIIGCGYNPRHKRVFFTLNSQMIHVIHCTSHEFAHPLFPTIAANTDATLVLNLGQTPFAFESVNSRRTPNPCSVKPTKEEDYSCIGLGFEDSAELFSMGRLLDSRWQHTNSNTVNNSYKAIEFDQDSDLFEIHLGHDPPFI